MCSSIILKNSYFFKVFCQDVTEPYNCPGTNLCISLQFICDGIPDCPDDYDENPSVCNACNIHLF